ncbi:MAG: hypothetical protein QXF56_05485 [Candidatus Micrarchaeia archaeon]
MAEYYFDIEIGYEGDSYENFIRGEGLLHPNICKIITIQFQRLDRNGEPEEPLRVLKEWEMGEEGIIREFTKFLNPEKIYNTRKVWEFIPVGYNLMFDLGMLRGRARRYGIEYDEWCIMNNLPRIDLKDICLGMNGFKFSGSGLDKFCGKPPNGELVPVWYLNKQYGRIIEYVEREAEEFISLYYKLREALPKLRGENGFYSQ